MNDERIETTHEQFEFFRCELLKWLRVLGLTDWKVYFQHGGTESDNAFAEIAHEIWPYCDRVVNVRFAERAPAYGITDENIRQTAFHEACEVLLIRLYGMAGARWGVDPHEMLEEKHAIIRRLENAFGLYECIEQEV
jgi:hypothetical protein